jgi:glutamyl-tRNA(Gln) amidotransferase subunit D
VTHFLPTSEINSTNASGYRGISFELLNKSGAQVGDRIRIQRNEEVYEGVLIPRTELGDERIIVIKLGSGYNIGVKVTPDTTIEVTGKGSKPTFLRPPLPPSREGLPKVAVISTGGTIASRVDYRTGSVEPALNAEDLYSVVPELSDIAQVTADVLYTEFSENLTVNHWKEIATTVWKYYEKTMQGVVICHGTDTMAYTGAALSFALQNLPIPVVLVGSQRSSDRPSSDAATNLIGAVSIAATSPCSEVVLVMHEKTSDDFLVVHRATRARKCHTSARDAFRSINSQPLARYDLIKKKFEFLENFRKRRQDETPVLKPEFDDKVALIKFYPNMNPALIDWHVDHGYRGLVLEGTGLGHVSRYCYDSIKRSVDRGLLVGMSSQCIWGQVNMNVYYTGRDLLSLGLLPLEDMVPETALVKMMWAFGQTKDVKKVSALMLSNIVGEISSRRTATEEVV